MSQEIDCLPNLQNTKTLTTKSLFPNLKESRNLQSLIFTPNKNETTIKSERKLRAN